MHKLKLDLEALVVETFETDAGPGVAKGTVFGQMPHIPAETEDTCETLAFTCDCPSMEPDYVNTCGQSCNCPSPTSVFVCGV